MSLCQNCIHANKCSFTDYYLDISSDVLKFNVGNSQIPLSLEVKCTIYSPIHLDGVKTKSYYLN